MVSTHTVNLGLKINLFFKSKSQHINIHRTTKIILIHFIVLLITQIIPSFTNHTKLVHSFTNFTELFHNFTNYTKLFQSFTNYFKLFHHFTKYAELLNNFVHRRTYILSLASASTPKIQPCPKAMP